MKHFNTYEFGGETIQKLHNETMIYYFVAFKPLTTKCCDNKTCPSKSSTFKMFFSILRPILTSKKKLDALLQLKSIDANVKLLLYFSFPPSKL